MSFSKEGEGKEIPLYIAVFVCSSSLTISDVGFAFFLIVV